MAKPSDITQPVMAKLAQNWRDIACVVVYYKGGSKSAEGEILIASDGVAYDPEPKQPSPVPANAKIIQVDEPSIPDDPCVYYQGPNGWESVCW